MISPTEPRLRRSDFQFSIMRLLVVTTTSCAVLAFAPQGIWGLPIWPVVLLVAFVALVTDMSSYYVIWGQRAFHQGDISGAIRLFSRAIMAKPGDPERYYARGTAYLANSEFAAALVDLTKAIQIEPNFWEAHYARGCAHSSQENQSDALKDFNVVIKLTPENLNAIVGRSYATFRLGEYASAFYEIESCLESDSRFVDGLCAHSWYLATCPAEYFRDGQKALEIAQRASGLSEQQYWSSEASLSAAYAELGRFDEAIKHGESALALAPMSSHAELEASLATLASRQPLRDECQPK